MEEELETKLLEVHSESYGTNLFGESVDTPNAEEDEVIGPKVRGDFNIFSFTDAIGLRKKRDAWILYRKALSTGVSAEELFYKVFWQVKIMLLAGKTKSPTEAGMKPFPYNKARGFLKNFKSGELEALSFSLVSGYHQVRRGEGETETLLEKMLLSL